MRLYLFFAFCLWAISGLAQEAMPTAIPTTPVGTEEYQNDKTSEKFSLTKYEPVYLLYGDPLTKLQFSFKYQLLTDLPLFFGYTQLVFWDLGGDSKPMHDVNYNPEVFYRQDIEHPLLKSIDFSPFSHFSNGRDGVQSRGYNKSFVQFNMVTPLFNNTLNVAARLSYLYDLEDTNQDIQNYVSPLDVRFTLTQFLPGIFDRGELYVRVFPGGLSGQFWSNGGQEIGLSFRPGGLKLAPSIFVQYYGGYAESLLDYNKAESLTRFGIIF